MAKKLLSLILALALISTFAISTVSAASVDTEDTVSAVVEQSAVLTFSNSSITETSAGSGYTIDGTTLTITTAGTYRISFKGKVSFTGNKAVVGKDSKGNKIVEDGKLYGETNTATAELRVQ